MTITDDPVQAPVSEREVHLAPTSRRPGLNTETLALGGIFIAIFALVAAVFAVGLAARAVDEHRGVANNAAGLAGGSVAVSLSEFAISPDVVTLPAGTTQLVVSNDGAVVHNLSVDGAATPMLDGGDTVALDISGLAAGSYTMRCDVPGHEAAGMKGAITIG